MFHFFYAKIFPNKRNHTSIGWVVLFCLALGLPALAQNGGISGRITTIDGQPLGWMSVSATKLDTSGSGVIRYFGHFSFVGMNGYYSFDNLASGLYKVRTSVVRLNYINETTNVEVFAGAAISNVDFVLEIGGIFTGTVRNALAEPLSNITVTAYNANGDGLRSDTTATDGTCQIVGLPSGTHFAKAAANGANYLSTWYGGILYEDYEVPTNAVGIDVVAGSVTGPVDFVLAEGGTLNGNVQDDQGVLLPNATVTIYDTDRHYVASVATDSNGNYMAVALRTDLYYVQATCSGRNLVSMWFDDVPATEWDAPTNAQAVAVTAGQAMTNINFQLPKGAIVEGVIRARADGRPLSGISISASFGSGGSTLGSAITDSNGQYVVQGLTTGHYQFDVFSSDQNYVAQEAVLDVSQGTVHSNINFKLDEGGIIFGRVTSADGEPLSGVSMSCYPSSSESQYSSIIVYRAEVVSVSLSSRIVTDTNGEYRISRLRTSTYGLYPYLVSGNYIYPSKMVSVTAGKSTVANFELIAGATIRGTVTAHGEIPVGGISIRIVATNREWWTSTQTTSASNGQYLITGLEAGHYFVQACPQNTNFISEWFDNVVDVAAQPPSNAIKIVLSVGDVASNINFELAEGGTIAGTVTTENSWPFSNVIVAAYSTNHLYVSSVQTSGKGTYALSGLPDGVYWVKSMMDRKLNVFGEWYDNVVDDGSWQTHAAAVPVSAGMVTSNINFSPASGGVITGRIMDSNSNAVQRATMQIQPNMDLQPPLVAPIYFVGVVTDSNGCYALGAWETGWYKVTTRAGNMGDTTVTTNVYVTALSTSTVDFVLHNLPSNAPAFDVSFLSAMALQWDAAFGAEYQVEQSTDLLTWANAVEGDAIDEKSWRLGGTGGFLEYHNPRGICDRLFLRVKQTNPGR